MARIRIPHGAIIDEAITLIDREGFEALSMAAIAQSLEVRPSALYGHLGGIDHLRDQLATTATRHLTSVVGTAAMGVAGTDALDAIGHAYRGFAHRHRGQYSAILRPSTSDNADLAAANVALHDVFARVYLGTGLQTDAADLAAVSTRSAIHGFVSLEHVSGNLPGNDARYQHLLRILHRGVESR
jgi:AcrR family transcriptional regulator